MKTIYLILIFILLVACKNDDSSNIENLVKELENQKALENQKLKLIENQRNLIDFKSGKEVSIINTLKNNNIKIEAIKYGFEEKDIKIKIENLSDQIIDLYGLEFILIDKNNNEYSLSSIQVNLTQPIKPNSFIFGVLSFDNKKEVIEIKNLKIFSRFSPNF